MKSSFSLLSELPSTNAGPAEVDTSDLLEIGGLARLLLISIGLVAIVAVFTSWLTLSLASAAT